MKRMLSMLALLGTFLLLPLVAQAQNYTVTFEQVEHCTITASYRSGGSIVEVESGDQVPRLAFLNIQATPEEGYMVTHYIFNRVEQENKGGSVNKLVTEDLTISARVIQSRPCTVTITQPEHGTLKVTSGGSEVLPGSQINSGSTLALALTPEAGYEIEYWIVNGKKTLPNEDAEYRNSAFLMLTDDITISAQLKVEGTTTKVPVTIVNPEFANIKVYKGPNSSNYPELQSGEELEVGSDITVVIMPKEDTYALDHWLINGEPVEKDPGYFSNEKKLKVVEATTISAVLKESGYKITYEQPEHGTLTVKVSYPSKNVPSGSRVKEGTRLNISATVEAGYQFKHFLINGEVKVPSNLTLPYIYEKANSDMTIEAVIEKPEPCIVTITPFEHGTLTVKYGSYASPTIVASGEEVPMYTSLTLEAKVDPGYEFKHFLVDGVETPSTYYSDYFKTYSCSYSITKPVTISVVAEKKPMTKVTIEPFEHGELEVSYGSYNDATKVNTGDEVPQGITLDVYAEFDDGYDIDHFLINGESKPADKPDWGYIGVPVGDTPLTISAVAKKTHGQIVMVQPDSTQGKMTAYYFADGEQKDLRDSTWVALETSVTFHVEPAEGYEMDYWLVNDARQELTPGMANNKVITVEGDLKVEPVLKQSVVKYTITMIQPKEGEGTLVAYYSDGDNDDVTDGMSVEKGAKITFRVTPAEGYVMDHWLINDKREELAGGSMDNYKAITVEGDLKVEPVLKKVEAPAGCTVTLGEWSSAQGFFYAFYGSDMTAVNSGDVLPVGTVVSFQVDAEGDYELDYWLVDDVKSDDTSNPLVITLSKDVKVLPVMKKKEEPQPTQGVITMIQPKDEQGKEIGFLAASYYDEDLYEDIAVTDGMGVDLGTTITFLVTPEEGYEMDYWMINDARQELDSETPNQTIITVEGDLEVEPILKSTAAPVEKVRLSVQEEGVGGFAMVKYQTPGSTTWERPAEGTNPTLDLPIGTKVRVEATISIGGATVAFTHNGNPVAADQLTDEGLTYEFTLEAAADIKVIFTEGVIGFQVFYDCDKHATVTGTADGEPFTSGTKLAAGTKVVLTVTPEDGYEVKDWVDDDFVLIEGTEYQNPYTFTVDGFVSVFAEIQKKTTALVKVSHEGVGGYLETKYVDPNGSGNPQSIFGDERIPLGSVVTVKAKFFMTGDFLVAYTNNGNPVPAEAISEDGLVYTFTANEDADVHAVFSEKPAPAVDYTITFEAGEGGTVTATVDMEPIESGAKIAAGTKIKILATPDEGYEIDEWLVDGNAVANTGLNFYYLSLSKDTNVKVTFRSTKPVEYVVTVDPVLPSAEAGAVQLFKKNGDAVESGTSVVTGTEMYVEVKPADKYELETLQVNNKTLKVGDENLVNLSDGGYKYLFTVTEAITIKATFKLGGAVEQLTASPIVAYVTNGGTRLEITGAAEGADVRLYDYTGQLLLSSTEHALDISALPAGSYIVLVGNYTTRIVK